MLDKFNRWIQFLEISLESTPANAPYIPLVEIISRIDKKVSDGICAKEIESKKAVIRIAKCKLDMEKKRAVLLLQYATSNATDPVFMDLQKGNIRTEPKLDGEGVAVSAHAVIDLNASDTVGISYKMLLEEVTGLGRSKISPFFQTEFRSCCDKDYEFHDELDEHKVKNFYPDVEILVDPTEKVADELQKSETILEGVEIISQTPNEMPDEEGFYTVARSTLSLTVCPITDPISIVRKIKEQLGIANKQDYNRIRLRYKGADRRRSASYSLTDSDIVDLLVARNEKIVAAKEIEQCSSDFNSSIEQQMNALMDQWMEH